MCGSPHEPHDRRNGGSGGGDGGAGGAQPPSHSIRYSTLRCDPSTPPSSTAAVAVVVRTYVCVESYGIGTSLAHVKKPRSSVNF